MTHSLGPPLDVASVRIFLAGEGRHELGSWALESQYVDSPLERGVLESLLRRVVVKPIVVENATLWRKIRKYRSGEHRDPEARNVLGVALMAEESGCDAVVFTRDRDRKTDRQKSLESGIERARAIFSVKIVGGVAVEALEAWMLAILGKARSEEVRNPKSELASSHAIDDGPKMVALVEAASLDAIPTDAHSLRRWLSEAADALA